MFAVIILGVGFVMIAAILPVAIEQSKANVDEATAGAVAQSAVSAVIGSPANTPAGAAPGSPVVAPPTALFPPTTPNATVAAKGRLYHFGQHTDAKTNETVNPNIGTNPNVYFTPAEQINALIGNMIYKTDPRFAWVGFYQRDVITNSAGTPTPASFAKLTVLTMQSRLRTTYTFDPTAATGYDYPYTPSAAPGAQPIRVDNATHPFVGTFRPAQTYVYLTERVDQPDILTFVSSAGGSPRVEPRAGEGAFVIIASDPSSGMPATSGRGTGDLNGKVYRLGQQSTLYPGRWELQPGYDMTFNATTNYTENVPYSLPSTTNTASSNINKPPPSGTPAIAYIVGRGLPNGAAAEDDDSTSPRPGGTGTNIPTGAVQDLSVYQCVVPIPQ
jgi:hypothetical protein